MVEAHGQFPQGGLAVAPAEPRGHRAGQVRVVPTAQRRCLKPVILDDRRADHRRVQCSEGVALQALAAGSLRTAPARDRNWPTNRSDPRIQPPNASRNGDAGGCSTPASTKPDVRRCRVVAPPISPCQAATEQGVVPTKPRRRLSPLSEETWDSKMQPPGPRLLTAINFRTRKWTMWPCTPISRPRRPGRARPLRR